MVYGITWLVPDVRCMLIRLVYTPEVTCYFDRNNMSVYVCPLETADILNYGLERTLFNCEVRYAIAGPILACSACR